MSVRSDKLLEALRNGPKSRTPEQAAREAATNARREMLNRGLADALQTGNKAKAEKYRQAIEELPTAITLSVRDDGDRIVLEDGDQ